MQLRAGLQRQRAVVFHQHSTVLGDLGGERVVRVEVDRRFVRGSYVGIDKPQDVPCGLIQILHGKRSVPDPVEDPFPADRRVAGHFQIKARLQRSDAVVHRAPVGHHQTVEAPFGTEHVGEQPLVLAAEDAVDLVVGAHDGGGLRLFDDVLERLEIQLPHGLFRGDGVAHEAVVLAVVQREVLERHAHALRLDALHLGGAHDACKQRVLAEILKVPPAERIALDVHTGAQQHVDAVVPALLGNGRAHPEGVLRIPA